MAKKKVVVAGAGLSGLSSAYALSGKGFEVEVFEKNAFVGGISSSFGHKGFILDYGPHKIYTLIPEIEEFIKSLMNDELLRKPKKCLVFLEGKFFSYPVKVAQLILGINPVKSAKIGIGFLSSAVIGNKKDKSYEDYLVKRFGRGAYSLVFENYAMKVWGNPKELSSDLAKSRVSAPNMLAMLKASMLKEKRPELSADFFYYPKKGIIRISERLAEEASANEAKIRLGSKVSKVFWSGEKGFESLLVESGKGEEKEKADFFISTMPLPELIKRMSPEPPKEVMAAAGKLKFNSLTLLYIILKKQKALECNWIYFPEKKFPFNRVFEQKGVSEFTCPEEKTALVVEFTSTKEKSFAKADAKELFESIKGDLEKVGICKEGEVEEVFSRDISDVYPLYSLDYRENLGIVLRFLDSIPNMISAGRGGLFNYNNMDHCINSGFRAADKISEGWDSGQWAAERQKFYEYKIID